MPKFLYVLAVVAVAGSLAGCSGVSTPSSETTEEFSDTLVPQGQVFRTFSVGKTGEMLMTLTTLNPRPVVGFIALAVGTPAGSSCSAIPGYIVSQAAIGQQYSFGQVVKGSYCLLVADANSALTSNAAFTVRFTHP
jgi:hypothetical protein